MKKRIALLLTSAMLMAGLITGCGGKQENVKDTSSQESQTQGESQKEPTPAERAGLTDGTYSAKFLTDSSMFHVNEANHDQGELTVKDGYMTLHVSLAGKGFTKLYLGKAEDFEDFEEDKIMNYTEDTVKFDDGTEDTVYGFDIPVAELDKEFDLACYGPKKDKWYDHVVSVSLVKEDALVDGEYEVNLTMEGGSGKSSIISPVKVTVVDGKATAVLVWSSKNYDYMIVNEEKYMNEATEGESSTFTVPIPSLTCDLNVIGDTVAMSTPHEIEYVLHFEMDK